MDFDTIVVKGSKSNPCVFYFLLLELDWSLTIHLLGTYFTCIMFMVASSCITTIMILNYHHRLADTHEMPEWVSLKLIKIKNKLGLSWAKIS